MNKTNLRQLKRNLHGVSVVIGALMLTLIVVTAAASFAIFTAQKQEELQKQEFAQLLREQEELSVNKIVDLTYDSDGNLSTISFSIANQHTRSSKIVALKINDHVISDFHVTDQTDQQTTGWTLKGKYYRTAYFANDTDDNLYVFDDLNGNHKVDSGEEILDNNPDGGDEADPEAGDQGYLYAKDSDGEAYLFNDTDFDGVYTTEKDFIVDSNGIESTLGWNDTENLSSTIGDELKPYYSSDNGSLYYADLNGNESFDPVEDVFWDNNTNGFDNNDKCLSSGKDNSTINRENLSWFKKSDNIAISGDDTIYNLGEDIIIDTQGGGTYSAEKEFNFSLDLDNNDVNATPEDRDRGGIYPEFDRFVLDSMEQMVITIQNASDDIIYFGETLKQNDALTIEVQTVLTNTFEKSFIPPTANFKVEISNNDELELDGSSSFHPQEDNEIVSYKWNIIHVINPFDQYTFKDLDGSGTYSQSDVVVNDSINVASTQYYGHHGGLFALNDSNVSYVFDDVNENGIYDGSNSDDVILNLSKNENGLWCKPEKGNKGGLFANDFLDEPFVFMDSNNDWMFDNETVLFNESEFSLANVSHLSMEDRYLGLYANNSTGIPYIFIDADGDWEYDDGEKIINKSLSGNEAKPSVGDPGGLYSLNESDFPFTFQDINGNWLYDDEYYGVNATYGAVSSERFAGQKGGIVANDSTENEYPYVFIDSDGDWNYDTEYIISYNTSFGLENATPDPDDDGGLWALDPEGEAYVFVDMNDNQRYNADEEILRYDADKNTVKAQPAIGDFGGLFAFNDSNKSFVFLDMNDDWSYNEGDEILDNNPYGKIGYNEVDPKSGDPGGVYAFDEEDEPYIFNDTNNNWQFDEEVIIKDVYFNESLHRWNESSQISERISNQYGGLLGFNESKKSFLFVDYNNNWQYDVDTDFILDRDPQNNNSDTTVSGGEPGGIVGINNSGVAFTFIDLDGNWKYDGYEEVINGTADPNVKGGLLAKNNSNLTFTFIDSNHNWQYESETTGNKTRYYNITNTDENAIPKHGDPAGLWAIDSERNPYLIMDKNQNWQYDASVDVLLDLDVDNNDINANPSQGDKAGLYALNDEDKNRSYIFIDSNHDWKYSFGETILLNDTKPIINDTKPTLNVKGGLYAINSTGKSYIFQDTKNQNWRYDAEEILNKTFYGKTAIPQDGDKGGIIGNKTGTGNFSFKDVNKNWKYDVGEEILYNSSDGSSPKTGNFGGLLFINSTNNYLFKDEDNDWEYDKEPVVNKTIISKTGANPENGNKGGLFGFDENNDNFTAIDRNNNWIFDVEYIISLDPYPYNNLIIASPKDGDIGGLFAANDEEIYSNTGGDYPSLLNNPFGEKKTVILEKPSWAETETMITLTVTDRFGMIGTYEYTLTLPPDKQ